MSACIDRSFVICASACSEARDGFHDGFNSGFIAGSKIGNRVAPLAVPIISKSTETNRGKIDFPVEIIPGLIIGGCISGTVVGVYDCAKDVLPGAYHGFYKNTPPNVSKKME